MIEIRQTPRGIEYRSRSFQVDASGAFCGGTEYDEWKVVLQLTYEQAAAAAADRRDTTPAPTSEVFGDSDGE